ncbi:hypothetical protein RhiirC2_772833 [Rhizophagus irregularis]|uniref:Uncharacterized protein n=1 Tax=Rhizophagus irregularis TaxID=588596 RepID=A0A2N1NQH9_9GLOM|nr:hypothetical protein RhiirC2_772833 [Rhizophagus irregularis]
MEEVLKQYVMDAKPFDLVAYENTHLNKDSVLPPGKMLDTVNNKRAGNAMFTKYQTTMKLAIFVMKLEKLLRENSSKGAAAANNKTRDNEEESLELRTNLDNMKTEKEKDEEQIRTLENDLKIERERIKSQRVDRSLFYVQIK